MLVKKSSNCDVRVSRSFMKNGDYRPQPALFKYPHCIKKINPTQRKSTPGNSMTFRIRLKITKPIRMASRKRFLVVEFGRHLNMCVVLHVRGSVLRVPDEEPINWISWRDQGAGICGPRAAQSPSRVVSSNTSHLTGSKVTVRLRTKPVIGVITGCKDTRCCKV